jgi:hypothetical protein
MMLRSVWQEHYENGSNRKTLRQIESITCHHFPIFKFSTADLRFWRLSRKNFNETKRKEAGHYSGLSMRTKRFSNHISQSRTANFCRMRRSRQSPYNTHGTLHFCINDVANITDVLSPASHQLWLQEEK